MAITKCVCGRNTDFGTLCVWCSRERYLDKSEEPKSEDTSHEEEDTEDRESQQ